MAFEAISHHRLYLESRYYCAFPAVCPLNASTLLVLFRRARDHRWFQRKPAGIAEDPGFDAVDHVDSRSHLCALRVRTDLTSVSNPVVLPMHPEAADQDASVLRLDTGRLLLAGFCWHPVPPTAAEPLKLRKAGLLGSPDTTGCLFVFWGGYTRISDDDGQSWTDHAFLPAVPGHRDAVEGLRPLFGGAVRGRPAELPDGTLALATYTNHPTGRRYASHLFCSSDHGASWRYVGPIAAAPDGAAGYAEPCLLALPDGRLLAFHRSVGLDDRLVLSVSPDAGGHWRAPEVVDVIGHPYDAILLSDGRVLLVYGHRHPPAAGVRARLWHPDHESLAQAPECVIRADSPSPDIGYPSAVATDAGEAAVIYYHCDPSGIRYLAGSRLRLD